MNTQDVLQEITFGERVAEEESEQLAQYFVETDHWRRLRAGQVDIVYGSKGSGKSALYSLLIARRNDLFDENILLRACENPRGAPAFKTLASDPPTSEHEYIALWKLYFACLISSTLNEYGISGPAANTLHNKLQESGLGTEGSTPLAKVLQSAYDYIKRLLRPGAVEVEVKATVNPITQVPSEYAAKIIFAEPSQGQQKRGYTSVDELLQMGSDALESAGHKLWLLLDRLDVAFAETPELEANALKALFRAYLDIASLSGIRPKIFLRTDIWKKITSTGFREASHITRHVTIEWSSASLLNLVVRRALRNPAIRERFSVEPRAVLSSSESQRSFFYKMFPPQVDVGPNKSATFEWMLGRVRDGSRQSAPRELIHLLNSLRAAQVRTLELGEPSPEGNLLFSRSVFKDALLEVSRTRLEQTLYAEYPSARELVELLRGEKTQHTPASLAATWRKSPAESEEAALFLVEIGFFEQRGSKQEPAFWVPFLYRGALDMVQGSAD